MMVGFAKHFLSRCLPVQINRDKRIQYIRNPGGHSRAEVAVDGEGRCDGGEEDVGETQGQSDADVQPHASFDLAGSCLLYTSPSPRDRSLSRMPSSA